MNFFYFISLSKEMIILYNCKVDYVKPTYYHFFLNGQHLFNLELIYIAWKKKLTKIN